MPQSKELKKTPLKPTHVEIILASTSPFRQKLLRDAGITFTSIPPLADETSIFGLPPRPLAGRRAEFKAIDVAKRAPRGSLVVGADQVLGFRGVAFHKSTTAEDAFEKIKILQGQTHYLHSAFCIVKVRQSGSLETLHEEVIDIPMTMKPLSDAQIEEYVATGEWRGCVGGYRVEGEGAKLFESTSADHSAIIGLPMPDLLKALHKIDQIVAN